jgi:hypothetical protein
LDGQARTIKETEKNGHQADQNRGGLSVDPP